jgi:hypothetical protein
MQLPDPSLAPPMPSTSEVQSNVIGMPMSETVSLVAAEVGVGEGAGEGEGGEKKRKKQHANHEHRVNWALDENRIR